MAADLPDINVPPAEAIRFFRDKGFEIGFNWQDVFQEEHATRFTVAKAMRLDILADIRAELDRALAEGRTFRQFQQDLTPILQAKGWWGVQQVTDPATGRLVEAQLGSPRRLRIIFDTNMRSARAAGRWEKIQRLKDRRPFLRYSAVLDRRTRPLHREWHGTILPVDHEWWNTHFPPNGWNCFPPGTPVATPDGWRAIETLKPGALVFGGSGNIQPVTAIHENPFNGQLRVISTERGKVAATPNHRFLTLDGWRRAIALKPGDILVQIPEVAAFSLPVGHINQVNAASTDMSVTAPIQRQAPRREAFDAQPQIWDQNVDPIGRDLHVKQPFKAQVAEMIQQPLLCGRGAGSALGMDGAIDHVHDLAPGRHLVLNFWPQGAGGFTQMLAHAPDGGAIGLVAANPAMLPLGNQTPGCGAHFLGGSGAPGSSIDPLCGDSLTAPAGFYAEVPHQPHQGSIIDAPALANGPVAHHLNDIDVPEGLASGAPLDGFNSLQDFRAWAMAHGTLLDIVECNDLPYIGTVHNLSVDDDESYCLPQAVVHNCRCIAIQMSQFELDQQGLSVTAVPPSDPRPFTNRRTGEIVNVPKGIDPGFAFNIGQAHMAGVGRAATAAVVKTASDQDLFGAARASVRDIVNSTSFERFMRARDGELPVMALDADLAEAVGTQSPVATLSAAAWQRQRRQQPDITLDDYRRLPGIAENPDLIVSDGRSIFMLIRRGADWLMATMRVSPSGRANAVTALSPVSEDEVAALRTTGQIIRERSPQ